MTKKIPRTNGVEKIQLNAVKMGSMLIRVGQVFSGEPAAEIMGPSARNCFIGFQKFDRIRNFCFALPIISINQ